MTITPRGWQAEALPVVHGTLKRGDRALISVCTGGGKSFFIAFLLLMILETLRPGWAVVVTVPTEALVEQLVETLRKVLGVDKVGPWFGRRKDRRVVTVCCLPSLPSLVEDLVVSRTRCALWIGDEVHRAESARTVAALEELAPARWLGVTATPYRASTGLTHWPELTYRYTMERAFREGVLVPPIPIQPTDAHRHYGEEPMALLRAMMEAHPEIVGPGVASADSIEQCEERASEAGWRAYHSKQPHALRKRLMADLQHARTPALVHVKALCEGVDMQWLAWIGLTSADGRNRVGLPQEVGRVLRCYPGKRYGYVFDPLGLMDKFDLGDIGALVKAADEEQEPTRTRKAALEGVDLLPPLERLGVIVSEARAELAAIRFLRPSPDGSRRASPDTLRDLASVKRGTRWLRAADRERAHALLEHAEALDEDLAAGLARALRAAIREAGHRYQASSRWPSGQIALVDLAS